MSLPNPFLTQDQQIVGDCYTNPEVMDNLITICDEFGSRFGGTKGERQAAEFFQTKMQAYGLQNVRLEPIEYIGWIRGQAQLKIVSPIERTIPCITLPHSPPADMESTLVDMGDGAPEDFRRRADEIKGNTVMVSSVVAPKGSKRWIHRGEKYGRSLLAGATGFVFVNHYPGFGPATGSIGHDGAGLIPGISICKEDGALIQRIMKRQGEVRIRLTTSDRCEPMTSWNVIGDLPGTEYPEQIVMLGSHYDGHDISQGAEDPASGTVSVLEAARLLAKHAPSLPRTVRFVLWGIEEIGLHGSRQYVKEHADELADIRFYLNMDSAGTVTNNRDIVLNEWPELEPIFESWSEQTTLGFAVAQSLHAFSDHFPFFMAGVPTGGMESAERSLAGRGYGHTQYDTVDKVDIVCLREASTLAARLGLRIASDEDWSIRHRSEQEVRALLDAPDYREEEELRAQVDQLYREDRQS